MNGKHRPKKGSGFLLGDLVLYGALLALTLMLLSVCAGVLGSFL